MGVALPGKRVALSDAGREGVANQVAEIGWILGDCTCERTSLSCLNIKEKVLIRDPSENSRNSGRQMPVSGSAWIWPLESGPAAGCIV